MYLALLNWLCKAYLPYPAKSLIRICAGPDSGRITGVGLYCFLLCGTQMHEHQGKTNLHWRSEQFAPLN